ATRVRRGVVAALDDWRMCASGDDARVWVNQVAQLADPDPTSQWRDRARDPKVWKDVAALVELARTAPADDQSVSLQLLLVVLLDYYRREEAISLARKLQAAHPGDFWATFFLARVLEERKDAAAVGHYRAAVALRPKASIV